MGCGGHNDHRNIVRQSQHSLLIEMWEPLDNGQFRKSIPTYRNGIYYNLQGVQFRLVDLNRETGATSNSTLRNIRFVKVVRPNFNTAFSFYPAGVGTAPNGDQFWRIDGQSLEIFYVGYADVCVGNELETANTGWFQTVCPDQIPAI